MVVIFAPSKPWFTAEHDIFSWAYLRSLCGKNWEITRQKVCFNQDVPFLTLYTRPHENRRLNINQQIDQKPTNTSHVNNNHNRHQQHTKNNAWTSGFVANRRLSFFCVYDALVFPKMPLAKKNQTRAHIR